MLPAGLTMRTAATAGPTGTSMWSTAAREPPRSRPEIRRRNSPLRRSRCSKGAGGLRCRAQNAPDHLLQDDRIVGRGGVVSGGWEASVLMLLGRSTRAIYFLDAIVSSKK